MHSVISKNVFISGALSKPCSCEQPTVFLMAIVEQQVHQHFFGNSKTNKCQNLWYFPMWPLVQSMTAVRYVCLVPGFCLKPFTSTKMFGFVIVQQLSLLSPSANIAPIVPRFPQKSFFNILWYRLYLFFFFLLSFAQLPFSHCIPSLNVMTYFFSLEVT